MDFRKKLALAKQKSIVSFLRRQGLHVERKGRIYTMKSPFTDETNPSFVIYESNGKFIDYSSDKAGDIIDLVMALKGVSMPKAVDIIMKEDKELPNVDIIPKGRPVKIHIRQYLQKDGEHIKDILRYARLRKIPSHHFMAGVVKLWDLDSESFEEHDAMIFPHYSDGMISGFKARLIFNNEQRFTARGKLGFYILHTRRGVGKERLYVVESETSASSLCSFLEKYQVNATILCFGGVNQQLNIKIPKKYRNLFRRYLVIDYDGDEELYKSRVERFKNLGLKDVKIEVEKGEDINSLYMKGMMDQHLSKLLE